MLLEASAAVALVVAVIVAFDHSSRASSISLLNITALLQSGSDPSVEHSLRKVAAEAGVFRIVGHGVDIDRMLEASLRLFRLQETEKLSACSSNSSGGFSRGYIPIGGESGLADFLELKEGFCYGWPWEQFDHPPSNPIAAANVWPPLGHSWRLALLEYFEQSISISTQISLSLAAVGRGHLSRAEMSSLLTGGEEYSLMRLFHYLPTDQHPEIAQGKKRTGSSPHTDWHVLTVILQDNAGGLQVQNKRGNWIDVPALPGELIIIVGDYMSALSGGLYHSPIHRVLLPEGGHGRYSYTLFHYPRFDARVPLQASQSAAQRKRKSLVRSSKMAINTLVPPGKDLTYLSEETFGSILSAKWLEVASNRA